MIGIVNKGWIALIHFLDEFVENVSVQESKTKAKINNHVMAIASIQDEIDIESVNKNMALIESNGDKSGEANEIYQYTKEQIIELNKEKRNLSAEVKEMKQRLQVMKEKQSGDEGSIENSLFLLLEKQT